MRPPAIFFAILSIGASNALAQLKERPPYPCGSLRSDIGSQPRAPFRPSSAAIGFPTRHRGARRRNLLMRLRKRKLRGLVAAARPYFRSGRVARRPAAGQSFSGATKRPVLPTRPMPKTRSSKTWSRYTATDKTICSGMTTTGGPASYVELVSCLEILRDAKSIEATDPLGGDTELHVSRADVAHAPRVRNWRADRGHRGAL
jgi:hypothetical protein